MLAIFSNTQAEGEANAPPELHGVYAIGSEGSAWRQLPDVGTFYLQQAAEKKLAEQAEAQAAAEAARLQAILDAESARTVSLVSDFQSAQASPHAPAHVASGGSKGYIYEHESGNNPCAYYPSQSDCGYTGEAACGLGGAKPCSKLRDVCALADYACQDRWWDGYAVATYGSWEAAEAFHRKNNWW